MEPPEQQSHVSDRPNRKQTMQNKYMTQEKESHGKSNSNYKTTKMSKSSKSHTGLSSLLSSNTKKSQSEEILTSQLRERDAQITALQSQVHSLSNKLSTLTAKNHSRSSKQIKRRKHPLPSKCTVVQEIDGSNNTKGGGGRGNSHSGRPQLQTSQRPHMARNASISTARVLESLPPSNDDPLASTVRGSHKHREEIRAITNRILDMFNHPTSSNNMKYLRSIQFATDLLKLQRQMLVLLEEEPRCAFLQSPVYVFGDIHGNFEDLHFFSDNVWRLGMSLTAGNFLFLGDYVDRGMNCLEVVGYLFTMKLLLPHKVFLLRGNHETRDVNGWEEHYGERSFIAQCRERFGDDLGYRVWESSNQVFDRLPLSAVIDQDIFCVHGGIPRPIDRDDDEEMMSMTGSMMMKDYRMDSVSSLLSTDSNGELKQCSRIQDILGVPKVSGINPPYEHESEASQQVASDCIWSDPASEDQESSGVVDPDTGFGESLRGGGAICFGHKAVTDFLAQHNFSYIMRAHEAHADGVAVSKGARVFTVFSTSKDHNQGGDAMAGCILVDFEMMQVINRSPAYRNRYIHRRDSVSLDMLTESEINQRIQLGLVTVDDEQDYYEDEDEYEDEQPVQGDVEDWDDFADSEQNSPTSQSTAGTNNNDDDDNISDGDDEDAEIHYILDTRRESVVDPSHTVASPLGSSHDSHDHTGIFDFTTQASSGSAINPKGVRRMSALPEASEEEDNDMY